MSKSIGFTVIILFLFSLPGLGQKKIRITELSQKASQIKENIPEGKALLVFECEDNLLFEYSMDTIQQPHKNGDIYKLLIDQGSCVVRIIQNSNTYKDFNFGTFIPEYPKLKNKELKYFRVEFVDSLRCIDDTKYKIEVEKANNPQYELDKEAKLIFYPHPDDLKLSFHSPDAIIKTIEQPGTYILYVKPLKNQTITISSEGCLPTIQKVDTLKAKEVRYYSIYGPSKITGPIGKGDFRIESTPENALIEIDEIPAFNTQRNRTPFVMEGYKSGTYNIKLSLSNYEIYAAQINIGSKEVNKLSAPLVPKFAFINVIVEPAIPITTVFLDGIALPNVQNGINFQIQKGKHSLKFDAPHYYSEQREIALGPNGIEKIKLVLKPKMGNLTISSGINAVGSEVWINDKKIGEIPIYNYTLQEGLYQLRFVKSKFLSEKPTYTVEIQENKLTNFKDLKMVDTKKVRITTSPVTGATIYIDGNLISDKSNLSVTLGIGTHIIRIVHEHYKTSTQKFTVDLGFDVYNFELEELTYPVSFNTKPLLFSDLYIDGVFKCKTPATIDLSLGKHKIEIQNTSCLNKKKVIFVSSPKVVNTKLFPLEYFFIGADYGLDQYRANIGFNSERVLLSLGIQKNANSNEINENELKIKNVSVDDINIYNKEYGRIYDSLRLSYNFKVGFTFKKPIVFVITIGCSFIQTDKYQKVYEAKHDYLAQNSGRIIYKGDLFSVPTLTKNAYTAVTGGLIIPIAQIFYLSMDYYSTSDIGPGFSFGLGFMFKKSNK